MKKIEKTIEMLTTNALKIYNETGYTECFKEENGKLVVDIDNFKQFFELPNTRKYIPGLDALPDSLYIAFYQNYKKLHQQLFSIQEEYMLSIEDNEEDDDVFKKIYSSLFITSIISYNNMIDDYISTILEEYEADSIKELIERESDIKYENLQSINLIKKYNELIDELYEISEFVQEDYDDEGQYVTDIDIFDKYDYYYILDIISFSNDYIKEVIGILTNKSCDDEVFDYESKVRDVIEKTVEYIVKNNI